MIPLTRKELNDIAASIEIDIEDSDILETNILCGCGNELIGDLNYIMCNDGVYCSLICAHRYSKFPVTVSSAFE